MLAQQLEKLEFTGDRFYVITAGEAVVVRNANGVETVLKTVDYASVLLQEQPRSLTATLGPLEGLDLDGGLRGATVEIECESHTWALVQATGYHGSRQFCSFQHANHSPASRVHGQAEAPGQVAD